VKVIGFNGSPRRGANTATLVETVLKGAADKGAETRMVNLNELNIKGCQGCGACKTPGDQGSRCDRSWDADLLVSRKRTA